MLELKVPIIGASIGFVLSFLVGLVSSATFSAIILRAFIMGIAFGALAFAARELIRRFLPELLEDAAVDTTSSDATGKVVDITVGEHQGETFPFDDSANADVNSMVPDFLEPDGRADGAVSESGSEATDGTAATVRSTEAARARDAGRADASRTDSSRADPSRGEASRNEAPAFTGGLDVLPDLQDFAPKKKDEAGEGEEPDPFQIDSGSSSGIGSGDSVFVTPDAGNMSAETETMAKAIRTILSRDAT